MIKKFDLKYIEDFKISLYEEEKNYHSIVINDTFKINDTLVKFNWYENLTSAHDWLTGNQFISGQELTIGDIQNDNSLILVSCEYEVKHVLDYIGYPGKDYKCLFVKILESSYTCILACTSKIPYLNNQLFDLTYLIP